MIDRDCVLSGFSSLASRLRWCLGSLLCVSALPLWAQSPSGPESGEQTTSYRIPAREITPGTVELAEAISLARRYHEHVLHHVRDYRCLLSKRERVDGVLRPYEHLLVKCRHEQRRSDQAAVPFSVYLKFQSPEEYTGREVLFVEGQNDGDMLVRKGGRRNGFLKVWLKPDGDMAMKENRYPISDFGIERLLRRLVEVAEKELPYGGSQVRYFEGAKVDGRSCAGIEVIHPDPQPHFSYYLARILVDDELGVPVHFASFDWPRQPGAPPPLLEEYTYRQIELNVGLSDRDFARDNPEYALAGGGAQ